MDRVRYLLGLLMLLVALGGGFYLFGLLNDDDARTYFRLDVEFQDIRGLKPGADVRCRGVVVGSVREVTLRDDGQRARARLVLLPGKEALARTNTRFWIVTPRFGGLTSGASGLETLVRDAYLAFLTPDPAGPNLADGSAIVGLEMPFVDPGAAPLESLRRGDLLMTLLIPENHGLVVGSHVTFRGMQTGDVRRIRMADDGTHIELLLRIARRYRTTVTDKTKFWVARPRLSGALMSGFSVEDVGSLLSPFIGYFSAPGDGLPVADGHRVAAELHRPDLEINAVPASAVAARDPDAESPDREPAIRLVRVTYAAVEIDWLSPNDVVNQEGTGVLFEDREGQLVVATTRSLCDAAYFMRDTFGAAPDVEREDIRVQLPDGPVLRALRSWVAPDGADLALLTVQIQIDDRRGVATTPADLFAFEGEAAAGQMIELGANATRRPAVDLDLAALPVVAEHRGAVVTRAGKVAALLGQATGTDLTPTLIELTRLPRSLRPAR